MSVRTLTQTKLSGQVYNRTNAKLLFGSALFDGAGDFLTVSDNAVMEFGSSSLTWEMWIKTASSDQYDTILARTPTGLAVGSVILLMNHASATAGDIALYLGDYSLGSPLMQTSGVSVRDNAWHHIAIVRDGSAWATYVDGVSRATATWSGSITDLSGGFYIGKDQTYAREYNGYISNLRMVKGAAIYTATFTSPTTQLAAISGTSLLTCQNQTGSNSDLSGNGLTVTAFGNTTAVTTNPFQV